MKVKQIILIVFLFWGASFSVSASYYKIDRAFHACSPPKGTIVANFDWVSGLVGCKGSDGVAIKSTRVGNQNTYWAVSGYNIYNVYVDIAWVKSYTSNECPSGTVLNPENGICEESTQPDCSATKDQSVDRQWNPVSFGSRPSYCYESCLYTTTEAVCTEIDGIHSCSGTVQGTGETCDADGVIPGGTFPDKNPDPDGGGDTGGGDTGGGDTGGGDTGGFDDSGIISKLDSMQIDSNEKLDSLAAKLDAMTTKADSNTTTLETAIKDAANTTKNGFDDLGGKVDGLGSKLDSLGSDVQGVGDKIDGLKKAITGVDVSGVGTGTCWETDSCSSFYKPEYPDGISGVFESHLTDIADKFSQGVIESFNSMDLSNASKPNYVISFDFGALGNFGSYDLFDIANLDALFLFIRIVLLASTVLYCRSLIFGG